MKIDAEWQEIIMPIVCTRHLILEKGNEITLNKFFSFLEQELSKAVTA